MQIEDLPKLNAFLNFCASICLVFGFYQIKFKKNELLHKRAMILALGISACFLASYLFYHYHAEHTVFPKLGWVKTLYLCILIPHIILAVGMLPLIFLTFFHAFKDNRIAHKKWAKVTFPIWLYVSITGVVIYYMVYVLAPSMTQ